jgi:hypothetical protein
MIGRMILSATAVAVALSAGALPALAGYDYDLYGGPHQTWCDVNPDCNGWNKRLHAGAFQSNAYDQAPLNQPLNQKHRPPRKRGRDATDR